MLPALFDVKLRKWNTLENETIELFVRLRTLLLSFCLWAKQSSLPQNSLKTKTEFTSLEKLINREVTLLFKCNLILLRQVLSMLLLCITVILLPLLKSSSFMLVSLILSSKSWSLRWKIPDNAMLRLSSVSYSLMEEITFLIFWRVFTLFWISFVPVWIIIKLGFFRSVGRT